jgi:predicted flavoprotein YhiN
MPGLVVIGGGPAGLMAAETARAAGLAVDLFEAKGSVGRKFLIAGKGGLNLTHSEPRPGFDGRYRERSAEVGRWLDDFDADALREWARGLGIGTYVGSSGRVFPLDRKAAPLLRGWVRRLREDGVQFHAHHRWLGWDADGALRFATPQEERRVHAGAPLKPVIAHWRDGDGEHALQGECVVTAGGIEGSLVYALSAMLRETIARDGSATLELDLVPGRDLERLQRDLAKPRNGRSLGEHLRRTTGVAGAKSALLHEVLD